MLKCLEAIKFICCTSNRKIMTFTSHLSIYLKKFRVGRHENRFPFFYMAIKLLDQHKNSGSVRLMEIGNIIQTNLKHRKILSCQKIKKYN